MASSQNQAISNVLLHGATPCCPVNQRYVEGQCQSVLPTGHPSLGGNASVLDPQLRLQGFGPPVPRQVFIQMDLLQQQNYCQNSCPSSSNSLVNEASRSQ